MMLLNVFVASAMICSSSFAAPRGRGSQNHGNNGNHGLGNNGRHVGHSQGYGSGIGNGHGNGNQAPRGRGSQNHGSNGNHGLGNNGRHVGHSQGHGNDIGNGHGNGNQVGQQTVDRHESNSVNAPVILQVPSASEPLAPPIVNDVQSVISFEEWLRKWTDGHQSCGYPGTAPHLNYPRIATLPGDEHGYAQLGNYPWMASLKVSLPNSHIPPEHQCGGTLISDQWVLTATHCLFSIMPPFFWGEQSWIVSVGAVNISAHEATEQIFRVDKIMVHPGFDTDMVLPKHLGPGWPSDHDIALVKLSGQVQINPWVRPACLPGSNQEPEPNMHCVVTGWGLTAESTTKSDILRQGIVPIMSYETCKTLDVYNLRLTQNMVCAGYWNGGVDACQFDSGGPLQCQYGKQWAVTGVVSWGDQNGPGCARPQRPGVYTRTDTHISWIQETIYADYAGLPLITWDKIIPRPYIPSH